MKKEMKKKTKNSDVLQKLIDLVHTLRKKCPWDRKQTLSTFKNNIIEEAYEVINAIEEKNDSAIIEEIGDLLFGAFFICKMIEEKGISLKDIISATIEKYQTKHPHVFRSKTFKNTKEIIKFWHSTKKDIFEGIPYSLPALIAARLIQERAARVGFDWNEPAGPYRKLEEEISELKKARTRKMLKSEMGDILFSCVNLARHFKIDSEDALRQANRKFVARFRKMQKIIEKKGMSLSSMSLADMDRIWNRVKNRK